MSHETSDGERVIGLSDIKNGKARLAEHDGLNKQIKFNQKEIGLRYKLHSFWFFVLYVFYLGYWNYLKQLNT